MHFWLTQYIVQYFPQSNVWNLKHYTYDRDIEVGGSSAELSLQKADV
jgi:hypothetical protein